MSTAKVEGPLTGLRVLDLSRILAGPWASQCLADLGAEVIKVERPGRGDDTRQWGPPWLRDNGGKESRESAYFLSANRGKHSVTIDISQTRGAELVRELVKHCDVLLENYKVGGLKKYGLDYDSLAAINPGLVYLSITGFGQDGPYQQRPGYDFMIQAMGGLMSITGEPDSSGGMPEKVGVAVADIFTGLYAVIAVQAALLERQRSGRGQYIDLALFDVQAAVLANQAANYLVGGIVPQRLGNAHPNIVPYQAFATRDAHIILAVGNDSQFAAFCQLVEEDWASDERFSTNAARVANREVLCAMIAGHLARHEKSWWLQELEARNIPCGPINNIAEVYNDPQLKHRQLRRRFNHALKDGLELPVSPLRFSRSTSNESTAPPLLGQHTDSVLQALLQLDAATIATLRADKIL